MEEAFFRTHTYLVEHTDAPVRRTLMDEIDWSDRLIGIKGTRGVGKSTFLLQYAKEHFGPTDRKCLYVNMNNFYFQSRGIADLAGDFCSPRRQNPSHRPGLQAVGLEQGAAQMLRPVSRVKNRVHRFQRDETEGRES